MSDVAESTPRLPTLAIATIGHHRHGKTTLLAAILRVLARRAGAGELPPGVAALDRRGGSPPLALVDGRLHTREEPGVEGESLTVRGCSLRYETGRRAFAHFDAPGRRPWLTNVARALGAADAALLVVSAPDSVQPQTLEHLQLARALGIRQLVVFVSKCDLVTDVEWIDLVEREVRELLDRVGFDGDGTRILRGAARPGLDGEAAWDASVIDLIDALETELAVPQRVATGEPLLYVDQVIGRRPGSRVLVAGRLLSGELARGAAGWLLGHQPLYVRVGELECYHRKIERASAGDQLGLLLHGRDREMTPYMVRSGDALIRTDIPPVRELVARVELFAGDQGGRLHALRERQTGMLVFGVARTIGEIRCEGATIEPGAAGTVHVTLQQPIHVVVGAPFALRDGSQGKGWAPGKPPPRAGLVGGGTVLSVKR